ncbi:Putative ribonuclease H protein At1g65750 [Linum perenne]
MPMFTLNTDGSVVPSTGNASAGGCIRDEFGKLVSAFSANLGMCSITRAKITGVVTGLERAWAEGIRSLEVQTDSMCVIKLLSEEGSINNQHAAAVGRIISMLRRDWTVNFKHVYREANFLADHLANKGHDLNLGVHNIDITDSRVLYWARYDLFGGSEARSVTMN